MEGTIAKLRRQLEEERQSRREAERPSRSLPQLFVSSDTSRDRFDPHDQGDATDPVNRLYPKRIVPWLDFPQLQEQVWEKFDHTGTFTARALFPSDTQIDYVATNLQNSPIYSEASLRNFERDTVDNFVKKIVNALRDDEHLRHEFGIQG
ncbi:hypothetical protein N7494_005339 [Penicillium frequentans]|uniref:Uncharacterized protein n=1 Tax=Penicillium frequentans TaxID=3151616 RepID=A0AAD6CXW2_9EURO|nr:hypothetical protein N7494_005339 [Penicillium glabrum]